MDNVNPSDFQVQNQRRVDETLLVRFFLKPRQDSAETRKQGRPVFKDTEYVEIRIPGSRDAVCRPARAGDIARFQAHYDAFKSRTAAPETGTPLSEWPGITRSQAEELSFYNVKTVEQLAAMSDQNASQFMGMHKLRQDAKEWLGHAAETRQADELAAELRQRDDEIAELRAAIEELKAKPATKKKAAAKKRPSRKKVAAKKE